MKRIENRQTCVKETVEGKDLNYVELLKIVMNVPPQQGYTISEMKDRLDIFSKLTPESDSIELEDKHLEIVKSCMNAFRWGIINKDLVNFVEYLEQL